MESPLLTLIIQKYTRKEHSHVNKMGGGRGRKEGISKEGRYFDLL